MVWDISGVNWGELSWLCPSPNSLCTPGLLTAGVRSTKGLDCVSLAQQQQNIPDLSALIPTQIQTSPTQGTVRKTSSAPAQTNSREPRQTGLTRLAGHVSFLLTHMKGANTDLSPGTSMEEGSTRILSVCWFSNYILGFTSRCQCLSPVVTDKNIAVNGEVKCSYCLGPRAKIFLKLSLLEDTLYCGLILLQAPSATDSSHHRIAPCTQLIPVSASNYFSVAKYIAFSGLFKFTCFLPLGQFSTSFIFFQSFSSHYNYHIRTRENIHFSIKWDFYPIRIPHSYKWPREWQNPIVNGSLAPPTSEAAQE